MNVGFVLTLLIVEEKDVCVVRDTLRYKNMCVESDELRAHPNNQAKKSLTGMEVRLMPKLG